MGLVCFSKQDASGLHSERVVNMSKLDKLNPCPNKKKAQNSLPCTYFILKGIGVAVSCFCVTSIEEIQHGSDVSCVA